MAGQYKDKVIFIGIDIYEPKNTALGKVKSFVCSMGQQMDHHVATQDSNFMETGWIDASDEKNNGIPEHL